MGCGGRVGGEGRSWSRVDDRHGELRAISNSINLEERMYANTDALSPAQLPNGHHLIDPTLDEELCLPSSRRLFVVASARLHATHLLPSLLNLTAGESTPGEDARLPPPPQPDANWEVGGWGTPSWQRVKNAIQVAAPMAGQLAETLRASLQKEEQGAKKA